MQILLPINIAKCPLEVFPYVNELPFDQGTTVTLLHVASPTLIEGVSMGGDAVAAEKNLAGLAGKFINPGLSTRLSVRKGNAAQEILAEARRSKADLIVLTSHEELQHSKSRLQSKTLETVLASAPCKVALLPVRSRFNCEEQWQVVDEVVAALSYVGLLRADKRWKSTVN